MDDEIRELFAAIDDDDGLSYAESKEKKILAVLKRRFSGQNWKVKVETQGDFADELTIEFDYLDAHHRYGPCIVDDQDLDVERELANFQQVMSHHLSKPFPNSLSDPDLGDPEPDL